MKTQLVEKTSLEEIEASIAEMISEIYEEAGLKEDLEKITPYHWCPAGTAMRQDDLADHLNLFGMHCHWKCGGFDGFVDDMGCFRYLPGNC